MTSNITDSGLTLRQALTQALRGASSRLSGSTVISMVQKHGFKPGDIRRELREMVEEGLVNDEPPTTPGPARFYSWAQSTGVVEHPMAEEGSGPTTGEMSWGEHSYEIGMQAVSDGGAPLCLVCKDTGRMDIAHGKWWPCECAKGADQEKPMDWNYRGEPIVVQRAVMTAPGGGKTEGTITTTITDRGLAMKWEADRAHIDGPDQCWCGKHHYQCDLCHADCTAGTERGPATNDGIKTRCRICQKQWETYRGSTSPRTEEEVILIQNALMRYSTSRGVPEGERAKATEFLERRSRSIARAGLEPFLPENG